MNHEHVYPKKWIISRMLQLQSGGCTHDDLTKLLDQYGMACVVTVAEHQRLSASKSEGWQRYLDAGIEVLDMKTGKLFDLHAAVESPAARAIRQEPVAEAEDPFEEEGRRPEVAPEPTSLPRDVLAALDEQNAGPAVSDFLLRSLTEGNDIVVARKVDGELSNYLRLHDATLSEPTPAAAYVHYTGNIHYRLTMADVPEELAAHGNTLKHSAYGVSCSAGSGDLDKALALLYVALERIREA